MVEHLINRQDLTNPLKALYDKVAAKKKGEVAVVYGPHGCGLTSLVKHDLFAQICSEHPNLTILHVECGPNPTPAVLPIIHFIELPVETNNGAGAGTESERRVKVILEKLTSINLDLLPKALPSLPFGDLIGTAKDLSDFVINHFDRTSVHRSLDPLPGLLRWKLDRISADATPPIIFFDGLENIGAEARAYIKNDLLVLAKEKPFLLLFGRRQNERTMPEDLRADLIGAGLNPNHSVFVRPFEVSEAEALILFLLNEKRDLLQGNLVRDTASKICIQLHGNPGEISIACSGLVKNNSGSVDEWNEALANITDSAGLLKVLVENYTQRLTTNHQNIIKSGTIMGPYFHKAVIEEAVSREFSPAQVNEALVEGKRLFLVEQNLNQKRLSTHAYTTGDIYGYLSQQVAKGYQTEWQANALKACIRLREEGAVDRFSAVDHIIHLSQECKDWALYGKYVLDKCQLHDAFYEAEPLKKQVEIALKVYSQEAGLPLPQGPDDGWAEWVVKILTAYQGRPTEYESLTELIAYRGRAAQFLDERSEKLNNRLKNKEERRRKSVADMIYEALGLDYNEAKQYVDSRDKGQGVVDLSAYPVKYIDLLQSPSARLNVYLRMQYFYHWELSHVGNDKSAAMESRFCSYKIEDLLKKHEATFSEVERADAYCALGFANSTKERKKFGLLHYHKALTIASEALEKGQKDEDKNNLARLKSLKATAEHGIGAIHSDYKNQVAEAKEFLQRSLRTHGLSLPVNLNERFPFESGNTFQILSSIYLAENNLDEAENHALASIKAQKEDTSHILYAYQVLLSVYISRGDLSAAQRSSSEIRDDLLKVKDWAQLGNLYSYLLIDYHYYGHPQVMQGVYNEFEALVLTRKEGFESLRAVCGTLLTLYLYRGMIDELLANLFRILSHLRAMEMASEVKRLKKTLDEAVSNSKYSDEDKQTLTEILTRWFKEPQGQAVSVKKPAARNGRRSAASAEDGPASSPEPEPKPAARQANTASKKDQPSTPEAQPAPVHPPERPFEEKSPTPPVENSPAAPSPLVQPIAAESSLLQNNAQRSTVQTSAPIGADQPAARADKTAPQPASQTEAPSTIERLGKTLQSWVKSLTHRNGH